ncbi:MAG: GNAT family N-acetyltransferase [Xenococcaceae cyanobacterium]
MKVDNINLVPFSPETDTEKLNTWLKAPHVVRWWGNPSSHLQQALEHPSSDHAIIVADDTPIGYLRWQKVKKVELDAVGLTEIPLGSVDIDILIGEVDYVGCGIGPLVLKKLVNHLSEDSSIPLIGMSTSVENTAAIKAYQKAGFRCLFQYDNPDYGRCWILGLIPGTKT